MDHFEASADIVKRKRGRPKVDPSLDIWVGVHDSKERKRIQDRLAQRTRRGRLLSKDPSYGQVVKKDSNEGGSPNKTTAVKRLSKKRPDHSFDPQGQHPPGQQTNNPKQCVRMCLALSSFDFVPGSNNSLSVCNDHKFLGWDAWPFYSALVTHGLMQGTGCPEAEQDGICPLDYLSLPESLKPTPLQLALPHKRWIDRMPFPRLRDNIILLDCLIDLEDFIQDLLGNAGILLRNNSCSATWDAEAWIITPEFSLKWGYLFI